jgi:hypothetical protein
LRVGQRAFSVAGEPQAVVVRAVDGTRERATLPKTKKVHSFTNSKCSEAIRVPLSLLEQVRAAQRALHFAEFRTVDGVSACPRDVSTASATATRATTAVILAGHSLLSIGTPPSNVKRKIVASVLMVQDLFQHLLSARDALAADEITQDRQKARKPPCREQRVGSSSSPGQLAQAFLR